MPTLALLDSADLSTHLLALLVIAITHFVGGIAAFGASMLAIPFLIFLYGSGELSTIIFTMVVVGLFQSLYLVSQTWRHIDGKFFLLMLAGAGIGMPIGLGIVESISETTIMLLLGTLTLMAGAMNLSSPETEGNQRASPAITMIVSVVAGIIHGAFASGGSALVAYAQRAIPDRDVFRATLSALWSVLGIGFLFALIPQAKLATSEYYAVFGIALAVLAISMVGHRLAAKLNRQRFQQGVSWLLVLSGLIILAKQVDW